MLFHAFATAHEFAVIFDLDIRPHRQVCCTGWSLAGHDFDDTTVSQHRPIPVIYRKLDQE